MKFPVMLLDERGSAWLIRKETEMQFYFKGLLSMYRRHLGERVLFDADMISWVIESADWVKAPPWWKRPFVSYVAMVPINVKVSDPQPYALEELKRRFLIALEKDDDALSQHEDKADIAEKIQKARRFSDIVWTWNWLTKHFAK